MIRKAEKKDASRLAEILIFAKRTSYRKIFNDDNVSFNEMQVLDLALEYINNDDELKDIYVYDDGIVKGLIRWGQLDDKERVEIYELYVDTFFQRKNIGNILIEDCISKAKKCGISKIYLWVLEQNYSARNFYEKHKFKYSGISEFEDGTTAVILRYELDIKDYN